MTADAILMVAAAELGYREKQTNAQLGDPSANAGSGNYTKYAKALSEAGYYNGNKNGYAWCDVFVDWLFYEASGRNATEAQRIECQTGDLGAGCVYSASYYKAQGRWSRTPSVGAQIFFIVNGEIGHTGIVEKVDGNTVTTIEGNSGDAVRRHIYSVTDASIAGYGLPRYTEAVKPSAERTIPAPHYGDKGIPVLSLQTLLSRVWGCALPKYGCDAEWGNETESALRQFCAVKQLYFDGEVTEEIWLALIGG